MNTRKIINNGVTVAVQHPNYEQEIISTLRSTLVPRLLREKIREYHEKDIAAAMEFLKKDELHKLYSVLDTQTLAKVLEYSKKRNSCLDEMSIHKRVAILSDLEITSVVEYLQQLDKNQRNVLLDLFEDDLKKEIDMSSSFGKEEIGSKMTTNYISIYAGICVRGAMKELIKQAADNDNISTIYVLDDDSTFLGAIDLKDLIIARETTPLKEIIMTSYPYVYVDELIEALLWLESGTGYYYSQMP